MSRRPQGFVRRRALALAAAMLFVSSAAVRADAPGADSPHELVVKLQRAAAADDLPGIVNLMTPKAREEMTMGMYLAATMVVAFSQMGIEMGGSMAEGMTEDASEEDKRAAQAQVEKAKLEAGKMRESYNKLVGEYGLPEIPAEGEPEPEGPAQEELQARFAAMDQGAFLGDVLAFLKTLPGDNGPGPGEASPIKIGAGVLEGLAIDGERATGTIDGEPATFVRIDGRWYFEPESAEEAPTDAATE